MGKCLYMCVCVCVLWRKRPVLHGRIGKDGVLLLLSLYIIEEGARTTREDGGDGVLLSLLFTIGGWDPYCTGGVRRRCYDICIMHFYKRL